MLWFTFYTWIWNIFRKFAFVLEKYTWRIFRETLRHLLVNKVTWPRLAFQPVSRHGNLWTSKTFLLNLHTYEAWNLFFAIIYYFYVCNITIFNIEGEIQKSMESSRIFIGRHCSEVCRLEEKCMHRWLFSMKHNIQSW